MAGRDPLPAVIGSIVTLGVVCTAIAFVLFAALIDEVGPVRATVITYIDPAVAAVLGLVCSTRRYAGDDRGLRAGDDRVDPRDAAAETWDSRGGAGDSLDGLGLQQLQARRQGVKAVARRIDAQARARRCQPDAASRCRPVPARRMRPPA